MTSMNISLPEGLKGYVEEQVKEGYSTPSEYVRELIREDQKRRTKERLDALLLEGLNSGNSVAANPEFWVELKREALSKLRPRKKVRE
jgi:antitoxin ParD1/3/4